MTRLTGPAIRVFALLRCDQLTHPALVFHQDLSPLSPGQYVVEYWAAHYYRGFEPILLRATTTLTVTPGTTVAEVPAVGQVGLMILAAAIAGAAASILRGTNRGLLPRGGGSRSLPIR